jgi:hypothetical protein
LGHGRVKQYRLISCKTSTDRQTIVHYADPKYRANLQPLCRVANWRSQVWEIDPVNGLGANICGRCIFTHEARMKKERKITNRRALRKYRSRREIHLARMAEYRAQTKRMRQIYRRRPEVRAQHAAYMREYRLRKKNEKVD